MLGKMNLVINIMNKKTDVQKSKRMVRYNGLPEASKFQKYHGWLHHYSEKFPSDNEKNMNGKKTFANLTGTKYAYSPKNVSENFAEIKKMMNISHGHQHSG